MKVSHRGKQYILLVVAILSTTACFAVTALLSCQPVEQPLKEGEVALTVSSPAFREGDKIPGKYTCEGEDVSPELNWSEPPKGTGSFVLIVDDPDAPGGVFTHWVLFNLAADSRVLLEAVPAQGQLPNGSLQGKNDFGRIGYAGPCPPPGRSHRYQFTLYSLDRPLDLKFGVSKNQVLDAIRGHILAQGGLTGTYQR